MNSTPEYMSSNVHGVKLVFRDAENSLRFLLQDGIKHGIQSTDPSRGAEPLGYYHRSGPLGDLFAAWKPPAANARVAVIGLGIGVMSAYAEPGQHFTFYEIDPVVADIAQDPKLFTYLRQCRGTYDIVLGDALLTLEQVPDQHYHMIILDAFAADVIPTDLRSPEAFELYIRKIGTGGILAAHISNVHANLAALLGAMATEAGLVCLSRADLDIGDNDRSRGKQPSHYLAMAHTMEVISRLANDPLWKPVKQDKRS